MEYYSAIKRKEILIPATTWMNFENMLSEISQTQKDKYCMISLILSRNIYMYTKNRLQIISGWG